MNNISSIDLLHLKPDDLDLVFRSEDRRLLEEMALAARELTQQNFGRAVSLFAPLYISNYCQNQCVYCGFQTHAGIQRKKLTFDEIESECKALAATGIRSCLILTGESGYHSPPSYIREAITIAAAYFPYLAIEVYPLETVEYRDLCRAGVDGVTLYQETYDRSRYDELHPAGPKKNYDYRVQAPERIARAGIRHISMGVLLGLSDWVKDVTDLFRHLRFLEKRFSGIEFGLSFPRLRRVSGDEHSYFEVSDRTMVKIISAARLLFPHAGISMSTRENPEFRDRIIELGITKMSAASSTRVGGYVDKKSSYDDGQFSVHDQRSLAEIKSMLIRKGYDPVMTEWRNIVNQ